MIDVLDVIKCKKEAQKRFVLNLILVIALVIIVIAIDFTLLFTSMHDSYIPVMIEDIVITSLLFCFLILYFSSIFPVVNHYRKLYKGLSNSTMEKRRVVTFEKEEESKVIDGVTYRVLSFSYREGMNVFFENLYILDNDSLKFEAGSTYRIVTFKKLLIKYEGLLNAKGE